MSKITNPKNKMKVEPEELDESLVRNDKRKRKGLKRFDPSLRLLETFSKKEIKKIRKETPEKIIVVDGKEYIREKAVDQDESEEDINSEDEKELLKKIDEEDNLEEIEELKKLGIDVKDEDKYDSDDSFLAGEEDSETEVTETSDIVLEKDHPSNLILNGKRNRKSTKKFEEVVSDFEDENDSDNDSGNENSKESSESESEESCSDSDDEDSDYESESESSSESEYDSEDEDDSDDEDSDDEEEESDDSDEYDSGEESE